MKLDLAKLIKERKNDITDSMKNAGWNQVNESISLEVESTLEREKKHIGNHRLGINQSIRKEQIRFHTTTNKKKSRFFFLFNEKENKVELVVQPTTGDNLGETR